jgi:S1-C subfamily serine protease
MNGYIMTNAHVVDGAQRIHVALPVPSLDFPERIAPMGKQRIVDAHIVGIHKDTDLALLKIDQTGPRSRLATAGRCIKDNSSW